MYEQKQMREGGREGEGGGGTHSVCLSPCMYIISICSAFRSLSEQR